MKRTPLFRLMLGLVTLSFMLAIAPPAAAVPDAPTATSIFINEIHYDNTGTDSGEAIEIAAPSGTNLTGWTIVLYNGSGGASYDTDPLGAVDGTCGSYDLYVVNYASNGIQNGSPDGMALVDASNTVIQFLSYEGVFAATNGAANGMTSTDIGVSENGSGAVGNSFCSSQVPAQSILILRGRRRQPTPSAHVTPAKPLVTLAIRRPPSPAPTLLTAPLALPSMQPSR